MNLDNDTMKTVVAKAIVDNLGEKERQELIANAIQSILSQKANNNYNSPTVLQDAFNQAVRQVAERTASEMLKDNAEMKEQMQKLMLAAWSHLTTGDQYGALVEKVSNAMGKAITGERY